MENETSLGRRVLKVIIPLVALAAIVVAGYFYNQVRILKQDQQVLAQQEVEALVAKVGRLIVLPEGETPTVATVADPEALKSQVFFAKAVKGDKVLIYTTAKKAILYSVGMNKILEVAPLDIGESQKASTPAPKAPTPEDESQN